MEFWIILGVVVLRLMRRGIGGAGAPFAVFLLGSGFARFLVEFIRRNDVVALGLTQAQILSFILAVVGGAWLVQRARQRR